MKNIKAILFDSGRTLNVPRTGDWFITPNFFKIIEKEESFYTNDEIEKALQKAYAHIEKILVVETEDQEYKMFKEFYEIVLKELKYPNIKNETIELLAKDNVYNDEKFLFFDDVEPALIKLKERFKLGIVSDTWPSLERVFINNNLRQYFSTFVMSSVHGSLKSENVLFKIAIEELGVRPEETIFVDDSETNLDSAKEFGLIPILIDVYNCENLKSKYPIINSINELIHYTN
ncbi:HAD family hydrolase [Paraclostridium bifermentans]|uniref:HAD family hydrolase n=2 Tax=Paraclostridium bifermentans TaxID=1490 RepID=UPI00241D95F5|nr:HAD family hydrolase [Paraclostridium bifermentans]